MIEELKPCPFCGGKVIIAETGNEQYHNYIVTRGMGEDRCGCRLFMESGQFCTNDTEEYKSKVKEVLIESWNRRVCQCNKQNVK